MSKLVVDQKSIKDLFADKKADFLIPDYQRPYAWEETECQTLWDDIFLFSFPENDCDKFNQNTDEYFLGPIVTFPNGGKSEVIDGQQRLTTLMLLLRAFYARFGKMSDEKSIKTRQLISQCIWKTDEFGDPDLTALKIDSEVATDNDKDEFLNILKTGIAPDSYKSVYASNYRFFQNKIQEFLNESDGGVVCALPLTSSSIPSRRCSPKTEPAVLLSAVPVLLSAPAASLSALPASLPTASLSTNLFCKGIVCPLHSSYSSWIRSSSLTVNPSMKRP